MRRRVMTAADDTEVARLYLAGDSALTVSRKTGWSKPSCFSALNRLGVQTRPTGRPANTDRTGQRVGRLVAMSRIKGGYQCRCDCGREHFVGVRHFHNGPQGTKSCGCLKAERAAAGGPNRKHGQSKTAPYYAWLATVGRATRPTNPAYPDYGGRGIRICQRWRESFEAYREDTGPRPSPTHTLDRIDNSGHYSCGKCAECKVAGWPMNLRWATKQEQADNRRSTITVELGGVVRPLSAWCKEFGLPYKTVHRRLDRGMKPGKALSTPVRRRREGTPEQYLMRSTWRGMISRCTDAGHHSFADYGGRGITVCKRWRDSFEDFLADMGPRPSRGHSLNRKDNEGPYDSVNCEWATDAQQRANKRPPRKMRRTIPRHLVGD
jgi:hypothetical protein